MVRVRHGDSIDLRHTCRYGQGGPRCRQANWRMALDVHPWWTSSHAPLAYLPDHIQPFPQAILHALSHQSYQDGFRPRHLCAFSHDLNIERVVVHKHVLTTCPVAQENVRPPPWEPSTSPPRQHLRQVPSFPLSPHLFTLPY